LALLIPLLWAAAFVLPVFDAHASVVFTNLYLFTGTNDGANPSTGLVQDSDGNFLGTTAGGGVDGVGTVFKISTNGAFTSLYSFTAVNYLTGVNNDGANPDAGLVQGSDGNFFGTTAGGGTNGSGTVFKINTNGVLTSLYSFTGGTNGASPEASLVLGKDGDFYGTTFSGGAIDQIVRGAGTVFKISANGALNSLYSFTPRPNGGWPTSGLVQGSDGNFYGTTPDSPPSLGGGDLGTVFQISSNGVFTSLYSFSGTNDGAKPYAGLVQGNDGNFYGTTAYGGANGFGTVFKITTNGMLTSLYSFGGTIDGANPMAGLVQGGDGNFYGTTAYGGSYSGVTGSGTVFKIGTNGALTSLYSFSRTNDGARPSGLVQGTDGGFYGTTSSGGVGGAGTVFRLTVVPAAPVFQAVTLINGVVSMTWSTEPGGSYLVQYNLSDLSPTNWFNFGNPVIAGGATLTFADFDTQPQRKSYRVKRLP
jgi:uncharacterized repeat protein (TIGR03803 family)